MLELRDITFTPPSEDNEKPRTIIDHLDYAFEKGQFYAITGPNGSGKTTVAKIIMGITAQTSGSVIFEGEDISGQSISERAEAGIAYAFQHSARFKGLTFRDLLSISLGTDDEDALVNVIARVGICSLDFLDKPVDTKLSGGEIKKIELATVIAANPKLAIYDEPDTGIDLWTIDPMVELLRKEQDQYGTTTIVVSHNRAFLEAADTLILIRRGKIAYSGDLDGALPLLSDLSICNFNDTCEGVSDVECYR
ncbi:MAG: ATP-binding cassette domain-containing protein [Deltaproteobacteria bacterium]|nr:ATP-binding cassette domain-containing protein [Deltaproteobacteria bacterium]